MKSLDLIWMSKQKSTYSSQISALIPILKEVKSRNWSDGLTKILNCNKSDCTLHVEHPSHGDGAFDIVHHAQEEVVRPPRSFSAEVIVHLLGDGLSQLKDVPVENVDDPLDLVLWHLGYN